MTKARGERSAVMNVGNKATSKKWLSILLIACLINSSFSADFSHECKDDAECSHHFTDKYVCHDNHCRRQFLEFTPMEISGLVIITILVAMTNSGGVGAGTVISPTLVIMFHFPLIFAIPQARVTITTGAMITFMMTGFMRRWNNPNRFQTDYSLAGVITPLLLAGSQVGVIFARWLPALIISVLLILYICISLRQTFKRAQKESKKESKKKGALIESPRVSMPVNVSIGDISVDHSTQEGDSRLDDSLTNEETKKEAKTDEIPYRRTKCSMIKEQLPNFLFILLAIGTFVLSSLMRGGKTIDSIVGIKMCSEMSWVVLLGSQITLLILSIISYHYNKKGFKEVDAELLATKQLDETEMTPQEARIKLIAATYLAGIIAGFIGVGGGMILGLYMLTIGMDVYASTALSNFIVLLSSSSTTFQFIAIGAVQIDNSVVFVGVAIVGSALGNLIFKRILKILQKPSLIVWLLFSVLWLALGALSFEAYTNVRRKGMATLNFGRFC